MVKAAGPTFALPHHFYDLTGNLFEPAVRRIIGGFAFPNGYQMFISSMPVKQNLFILMVQDRPTLQATGTASDTMGDIL